MRELKGTVMVFLPDGIAVAYMLEGEVRHIGRTFVVEVPVTLYDEEWQWLDSSVVHLGIEDGYHSKVTDEVLYWIQGRARTTHATG